jgi:hypothetical protein
VGEMISGVTLAIPNNRSLEKLAETVPATRRRLRPPSGSP